MLPVLGRKIVEGEQRVAILDQALDRLVVFDAPGLFTRRSKPEHSNAKARKVPGLVPAPSPIDRIVLDPGLDFVFHKDGMIELTGAGFRRMAQAHCAAIDVVIGIDGREVLRFPAGVDALAEKEITDFARPSWGTWFERWARTRSEVLHNDQ